MACSDMIDLLVTCEERRREVEFSKQDASYKKLLEKLAEEFRDVLREKGPISHIEIFKEKWKEFVELTPRKFASDVKDGSKLRVILKNDEAAESTDGNSSTDLPELVPYCTEPLGDESTVDTLGASDLEGQEGSAAYALKSKLWIGRDCLLAYFLNSEILNDNDWKCGKSGQLNVANILGWAEAWKPGNCSAIPKFKQTDEQEKADIRIKFADGGCWSRVGRDAEQVLDKSEPTMVLSLKGLSESEQKFFVRHEFGHALGLLHEHQRYDFWGPASSVLDVDKMRNDPRMRHVKFDRDMFAKGPDDIETEYDADSVMHYWFDINWLKNSKHKKWANIESDKTLTNPQKMILKGIHTRNLSYPSGPSERDLAFLQQHYSTSTNSTLPAAGRLPQQPLGAAGGNPSLSAPAQGSQPQRTHPYEPTTPEAGAGTFTVKAEAEQTSVVIKNVRNSPTGSSPEDMEELPSLQFPKCKPFYPHVELPSWTLNTLYDMSYKARFAWDEIGMALEMETNDLKAIEMNNLKDVGKCYCAMLSRWLQSRNNCFLDSFLNVLEKPQVNQSELCAPIKKAILKELVVKGALSLEMWKEYTRAKRERPSSFTEEELRRKQAKTH